ncbi:MAG: hypothetical protein LBB74_09230 [Chitinispirillales bacterium]|jgi:hypothetical protein|nr:hypothetical protein [Chitinispirillales bacterium]
MTLHEAYLKAKSDAEKIGFTVFDGCRDFGDFWGFRFEPPYDIGDGSGYFTVNKKTGKKGSFNLVMDWDLAEKSVEIPIEQFADYNVAV